MHVSGRPQPVPVYFQIYASNRNAPARMIDFFVSVSREYAGGAGGLAADHRHGAVSRV